MLFYENLDLTTRAYMLHEANDDIREKNLYLSPRLNQAGRENWAAILTEALEHGDDETIASKLIEKFLMNEFEERKKAKGGTIIAKVPVTATQTLAEGEFNRFYIRGLCLRAIEERTQFLEVYRGKKVANPRLESIELIGKLFDPRQVLADLRVSIGVETALGVPPGPNSGLTLRIPPTD